jgi:hypothetical protein
MVPYLSADWFRENINISTIIENVIKYVEKYTTFPNAFEMRNMLRNDTQILEEFDAAMEIPDEECMTEYILDDIEIFVRKKLIYQVTVEIQESLFHSKGDEETSYAQKLADAEAFTFKTDIGLDLVDDLEMVYEDMITCVKVIGTGLKDVDILLNGGVPEKVMIGVLAATNVGKTLIMTAIASNMMAAGHNVLYITMEDPDKKIALRMMQNICNISQDQLKMLNKNSFISLKEKMKALTDRHLKIVELPDSTANAMRICTVLKDLKDKKNFVPEIIFLDYIGCMIPNGRPNPTLNSNTILQKVAAETRGAICTKMGIPIVTALQTNRGGFDSASVDLNDVADSYGSTMKLDAVLAATQDTAMLEQGMYKLKVAKTRLKNNKGTELMIGVNIDKQQIYDLNGSSNRPQVQILAPTQATQTQPQPAAQPAPQPAQPENKDVVDNTFAVNAAQDLDKINQIL